MKENDFKEARSILLEFIKNQQRANLDIIRSMGDLAGCQSLSQDHLQALSRQMQESLKLYKGTSLEVAEGLNKMLEFQSKTLDFISKTNERMAKTDKILLKVEKFLMGLEDFENPAFEEDLETAIEAQVRPPSIGIKVQDEKDSSPLYRTILLKPETK